ncbi:hypothetical protein KO481_08565 [Nocardia sp. NEAU-G5]|uniref:Anti-sigma-D factor RsdA sigma factor binding region domain-containing protein n=1 Tax=Nocardia albiluteola TaxID=2842303 RepID=A0ABS6AX60_9NOCA|nr:anti-sigma-D factor RsdA [Nocardia albiluteola]MBU3061574.1 hypothetical protein [Nocardia albiluteola]
MARDGERGRGDWKARLGSHNSGPYADDSGDTGPVDIVAVRRDDALIDAIASDGPIETGSDEEFALAALLANWRSDIVDEPLPAGPDLDDIVAAVNQEIGARQVRTVANKRGHLRLVRPLMGAAAAIALIAGGMTAFSYSAQPGDPLWKVKEVVFSEQAQTTIANNATNDLAKAQVMIEQGEPLQAKALLQSAQTNATQLDDSSRKETVTSKWNQVWTSLNAQHPDIAASLLPTPASGSGEPTTTPSSPTTSRGGNPASGGTTSPTSRPPNTLPGGIPIPTLPPVVVPTLPPVVMPTLPPIVVPTLPGLPGQPGPTHAAPPPAGGTTVSPAKPGSTTAHPSSMPGTSSTIAVEPTASMPQQKPTAPGVPSAHPGPGPILPTALPLPTSLPQLPPLLPGAR